MKEHRDNFIVLLVALLMILGFLQLCNNSTFETFLIFVLGWWTWDVIKSVYRFIVFLKQK